MYSQRFKKKKEVIHNVVKMAKHFERLNHFRNLSFSENSHHLITIAALRPQQDKHLGYLSVISRYSLIHVPALSSFKRTAHPSALFKTKEWGADCSKCKRYKYT